MASNGYIVEFNGSDGLPPLVVRKLNHNFLVSSGGGFQAVPSQDSDSWPSATAADVVSKLGSTPVGRATADAAGNDIAATYALKADIESISDADIDVITA